MKGRLFPSVRSSIGVCLLALMAACAPQADRSEGAAPPSISIEDEVDPSPTTGKEQPATAAAPSDFSDAGLSPDLIAADLTVYITVDDGPLAGFDNILSVLEAEEVHATFYVVGQHIHASQGHRLDFARSQDSPYVLVANHSYSHANGKYAKFYSDTKGVIADMQQNNQVIGFDTPPYPSRLPGRNVFRTPQYSADDIYLSKAQSLSEAPVSDALYQKGFHIFGWDLIWSNDSQGRPVQSVDRLMSQIAMKFNTQDTVAQGHLILLLHDQMFSDRINGKALFASLIKNLKDVGYQLATIDSHPFNAP